MGATHLVAGSSGSGKTFRVADILRLKSELIVQGEYIKNIIFYYAAWQPVYEELKKDGVVTKWVNKMPTNAEFVDAVKFHNDRGGSIVIIDDFMGAVGPEMANIVCVSSRHNNVSTFILFQSLFPSDKSARLISRNVKFIHLHKTPRDNAQVRFLASQLCPGNFRWIVKAYHEATSQPYSCFLFDFTQQCPEQLRYRSHYLPREFPMRVWQSRNV
jgi:hypothetical protein